ncbi:hypothetical protein FACS1894104_5310 [Actinomycetota bacterium]|nr:hypothetical protein FACS1894104_5310 [Actinomycetota bacterium]
MGTTTITDPETPLAAPSTAAWALINLILAIISLVFAIALAIGFASRRKGEEANKQKGTQDSRGGRGVVWRTIAVIFGVASPIVFILTEDVTLPMIWVDAWTLLMVVLLAVQIVSAVALKYARREDDSNNQQAQTA